MDVPEVWIMTYLKSKFYNIDRQALNVIHHPHLTNEFRRAKTTEAKEICVQKLLDQIKIENFFHSFWMGEIYDKFGIPYILKNEYSKKFSTVYQTLFFANVKKFEDHVKNVKVFSEQKEKVKRRRVISKTKKLDNTQTVDKYASVYVPSINNVLDQKIPTTPAKSNYSVQYNRNPHGLKSLNRNENVVPKIPTTPAKSNYSVQYNRNPHGLKSLNRNENVVPKIPTTIPKKKAQGIKSLSDPLQDENSMKHTKKLDKRLKLKKEEKIMKREWRYLKEQLKKTNDELLRKHALLKEMNKIS